MRFPVTHGISCTAASLLAAVLVQIANADPVRVEVDWPNGNVNWPQSIGRVEVLNAQTGACEDGVEGFKWDHTIYDKDIADALAKSGCPAGTLMVWHTRSGSSSRMLPYVLDETGHQVSLRLQLANFVSLVDNADDNATIDVAEVAGKFNQTCAAATGNGELVRLSNTIRYHACAAVLARFQRELDYIKETHRGAYGQKRAAPYERFLELATVAAAPEGNSIAANVIGRAGTAKYVDDLEALSYEYANAVETSGSSEKMRPHLDAIREQLAIAVAHRADEFQNAPAWLMTAGFASRPAAERDYSVNEQAIRNGAPLQQYAGKAPTDTEIGLALLRSMAKGGNVGLAGGKRDGANSVALTAFKGVPADVGGGLFTIRNVRKSACVPEGARFLCTYKLWASVEFSEAQNDVFARMPESLYAVVVGPMLAFGEKSHELQEVFELTPDGWLAPEVESRMSDMSFRYQQGVVAGMRASARYNTCMARQLANDPTVNTDPDC